MRLAMLILMIAASAIAFGANITRVGTNFTQEDNKGINIYLDGSIEDGDFSKFISIIKQQPATYRLYVNSPGGNGIEGMKIGRFSRDYLLDVFVTSECSSACFLIFAGATKRVAGKPQAIGLHRPAYEKDYFSSLSSEEAEREYDKLTNEVKSYLLEMNIPTSIIDIMMTTPSDRAYYMDGKSIVDAIGSQSPSYHEWAIAKCGSMSEQEERDLDLVKTLLVYPEVLKINPEAAGKYEDAVNTASSFSLGYRVFLVEIEENYAECIETAEQVERAKVLRRYK